MKDSFPGYYPLDDEQMKGFLSNSIIVLDVYALLDLYHIELGQAKTVLDLLERDDIKARLWIPYDVAWLYHLEMNNEILSQVDNINTALKHLISCKNVVENAKSYPFLPVEVKDKLEGIINDIDQFCATQKQDLVGQLKNSDLKTRLGNLFHDKMGTPYSDAELDNVYKVGNARFAKLIPPGYIPCENTDKRKRYHDLIVWKQILAYATQKHKDILLVTGRIKQDWYYVVNSEEVVPRQELINEFMNASGKRYYSLSLSRFIKKCQTDLGINIPNYAELISSLKENIQYASVQQDLSNDNQV